MVLAILARIEHFLNKLKKHKTFNLKDYLKSSCVVFLDAKNRNEAITSLVDSLYSASQIHERNLFTQAILARELQSSTAIGDGIAVPHTKSGLYNHFFLAVGIVQHDELKWDENHPEPIHFVFLIGGPDHKSEEYLAILSHLTAAVKGKIERTALLSCNDPHQIIDLLSKH